MNRSSCKVPESSIEGPEIRFRFGEKLVTIIRRCAESIVITFGTFRSVRVPSQGIVTISVLPIKLRTLY